jgi:hypothetical protein
MQFLSITTIQSDLQWESKEANLKMFEEKILQIKEKTNILVCDQKCWLKKWMVMLFNG